MRASVRRREAAKRRRLYRRRHFALAPFLLCIVDEDTARFAIEGPMIDADAWIKEVIAARRAGREINCHVLEGTPDDAAEIWMRSHGGTRWPSGSIVAPAASSALYATEKDATR
jgi:hypothetical protein